MSENDIIAMYVRNAYPNMLTTVDFKMFRLSVVAGETHRVGKKMGKAYKDLNKTMSKKG